MTRWMGEPGLPKLVLGLILQGVEIKGRAVQLHSHHFWTVLRGVKTKPKIQEFPANSHFGREMRYREKRLGCIRLAGPFSVRLLFTPQNPWHLPPSYARLAVFINVAPKPCLVPIVRKPTPGADRFPCPLPRHPAAPVSSNTRFCDVIPRSSK